MVLNQEDFEKIEQYFNIQANDDQKTDIEFLLIDGEYNESLKQLLEKDWEAIVQDSKSPQVNLDYLLDQIHHVIRLHERNKKCSFAYRLFSYYTKIAAAILLPLIIAWGILFNLSKDRQNSWAYQQVENEIYAPYGSRVSFSLPDRTTGMLNSGSRLSYTVPFSSNRNIDLEGEAWFNVTRDEQHPFNINAANSTVTVTGTSFNISAYSSEDYIEIVLEEGEVEFLYDNKNIRETIKPSERLVFKQNTITKTNEDPEKYKAWTEGKLVFRGDPMLEVARRIERWYNVKVVLADKELEKYSFRATFEDDSLEDIFRFLSMTSPMISYKITPRQLLSDSTYSKEIITVFLK